MRGGLLAEGNSQHRPKCVNWLSPVRGDGGQGRTGFCIAAVWPLVGYGLGPGRRRFASNMPRICCAFAITSRPARDADVMAPACAGCICPHF